MDDTLDLRGLKCPLPALLAKKALAKIQPGATLTMLADDPLAAVDIPHMCFCEGHAMEEVTATDGGTLFRIRSAAAPAAVDAPARPDDR